MKQLITALLATGLMGSAFAQNTKTDQQPAPTPAPAASIPGAKTATTQSLGDMVPFYVVGGVVVVGAIVAATDGGNGHKGSAPGTGTTGTTGTH